MCCLFVNPFAENLFLKVYSRSVYLDADRGAATRPDKAEWGASHKRRSTTIAVGSAGPEEDDIGGSGEGKEQACYPASGHSRTRERLRERIAKDGDFPEEWNSLSDREIELKIYELTRDDGKPPAGWENTPKLVYARRGAVPDEWRVELAYRIRKRQFKETVEGLVRDYDGTLMSEMDLTPFYRGFWIKVSEDGAKRISEDPRVRRVWQNGVAEAIIQGES